MSQGHTAIAEQMLSYNEVVSFMTHVDPSCSTFIEGQPGIGKTAMANIIAKARDNVLIQQAKEADVDPSTVKLHKVFTLDCTAADAGDIMLPAFREINTATGKMTQVSYAPNEVLNIGDDHPIVLLFDELPKSMEGLKNAVLPILQERRVAGHYLPEGSVVMATGNFFEDGLGDNLPAHACNRVTFLKMRNPHAQEWAMWAAQNNLDPLIIAVAHETPQFFQMYNDAGADSNPYIYNPRKPERKLFTSPRSLEKASKHLAIRKHLSPSTLAAILTGTVGQAASEHICHFQQLSDKLPKIADVLKNPATIDISKLQNIEKLILGFNLVQHSSKENAKAIMTFVKRPEFGGDVLTVVAMQMIQGNNMHHYLPHREDLASLAASVKMFGGAVS